MLDFDLLKDCYGCGACVNVCPRGAVHMTQAADGSYIPEIDEARCIGCGRCTDEGCVFTDDGVNEFIAKAKEADGFIFGTPVYYAHPSGRILSFLDRVFYSSEDAFAFKPGAAVAIARRGGTTASFDAVNKYFGISNMPVVSSSYWNIAHGCTPGEVTQDAEGMQTMRNLARNMAWMLKCFEAGKASGVSLPAIERGSRTNFIR